jgi:hypothetical protein
MLFIFAVLCDECIFVKGGFPVTGKIYVRVNRFSRLEEYVMPVIA